MCSGSRRVLTYLNYTTLKSFTPYDNMCIKRAALQTGSRSKIWVFFLVSSKKYGKFFQLNVIQILKKKHVQMLFFLPISYKTTILAG